MAFIPIGDDNSDRVRTPFVNYLLLAANILVFALFQQFGGNLHFTMAFATVPAEIVQGEDLVAEDRVHADPVTGDLFRVPDLQPTPVPVYLTLLTGIFMHGGLLHLLGNMLYLWIFGDNIENLLGHGRYLVFYLVTGVLASLAHVATTYAFAGDPLVPSLGASGAISAILGGYVLLFPRRRVLLLMFRFVTPVPAIAAIGLWFVFQLVAGAGMLGGGAQRGGVAYGAHIGGFLAGLLLVKFFAAGRRPPRPDWARTAAGRGPRRDRDL